MDIRIQDLFCIYKGSAEPVVALRGLHLNIPSGECLVIKGPNGSGKSTLVKILTGFIKPTAGKILIGDRDISTIDPLELRRELVSSIDQRGNLLEDITILDNIALAYSISGESYLSARKLARESLTAHNLEQLSHRYREQLSAGERQFSSLLAALATNPKILIADEPSGELDNASAEIMYTLLKSLAGKTTVILVTHDPRAEGYADRVVAIREGRISEEWLPGKVEESVIDPFGWMRVRETLARSPKRNPAHRARGAEILINGRNIGLSYAGREIFSRVNLHGSQGEVIALASTSGSGKSSLLRILCGIQDPTQGDVLVQPELLRTLSRQERANLRKERIGFLAQGGSSLGNTSLRDYVHHMSPSLEASFGTRASRPLSAFSGGERARIELMKILSEGKPILLLDEPTSQMDERSSIEAVEMILEYADNGGLVITSTRDPFLLQNADRIIRGQ
jgi:ABC-type lipoprotein export system ATPase subunit